MADRPPILEDFRALATEAAAIARERCGACQTHHMLWPLNRFTRVVSAVEGGREAVSDVLARTAAGDRKRILIAGCSDTGVLCLAANAVRAHGADFTVIDRCDTPLELCRRFAQRWDLRVATLRAEAIDIAFDREFDIVLAHSLLQFIAPVQRVPVFRRFAAALKPTGTVIQVYNAGARIEGALAQEHARDYPALVLERFEASGLPLPEPREALLARLEWQSGRRRQLEGAVASPEEFDALMAEAGFTPIERHEIAIDIAENYERFLSQVARRRYVSVARLKSA